MSDLLPRVPKGFPIPQIISGGGAGDVVSGLNQVINAVNSAAGTTGFAESIGARLRRLRASAKGNNWYDLPPLGPAPAWPVNTTVYQAQGYSTGGLVYVTIGGTGGVLTDATNPPTGTGAANIANGAASCFYLGKDTTVTDSRQPTITCVTNATATASNPTLFNPSAGLAVNGFNGPNASYDPTQDVFKYFGGLVEKGSTNGTTQIAFNASTVISGGTRNGPNGNGTRIVPDVFIVEVSTDDPAPHFGFSYCGNGGAFTIDGRLPYFGGTGLQVSGNPAWLKVDNGAGAQRMRTYRIYMSGSVQFAGLRVVGTSTAIKSPVNEVHAVGIGSSYMAGGNGFPQPGSYGWLHALAAKFGWDGATNLGQGGTGYTTGGASSTTYVQRVGDVLLLPRPADVVIFEGPSNADVGVSTAVLSAAALQAWGLIRQNYPLATIIVLGAYPSSSGPSAATLLAEATVFSAFLSFGDPNSIFISQSNIPPSGGSVVTGTGKSTAPTGVGNADWAISSDGTHPTQRGISSRTENIETLLDAGIQLLT